MTLRVVASDGGARGRASCAPMRSSSTLTLVGIPVISNKVVSILSTRSFEGSVFWSVVTFSTLSLICSMRFSKPRSAEFRASIFVFADSNAVSSSCILASIALIIFASTAGCTSGLGMSFKLVLYEVMSVIILGILATCSAWSSTVACSFANFSSLTALADISVLTIFVSAEIVSFFCLTVESS